MSDDDARTESYRFALPDELIARRPADRREDARLLALLAADDAPRHLRFPDVQELVRPGDCLVLNDTAVIPARLFAEKAGSGGRVEVVLGRPLDDGTWSALLRPAKRVKPGQRLVFGGTEAGFEEPFFATVRARLDDEPGAFALAFEGDPVRFAEAFGEIPLPPYLDREADDDDRVRYQTVYADPAHKASSAAPTAGLHFTTALLDALVARGVALAKVTLHVGPGTFLPMRGGALDEHVMHAEPYTISAAAATTLNATRARGGRVIPVGTTALRAIESALDGGRTTFAPTRGLTRLFIRPGYTWRAVDALITNFHLPESTLLVLVAALVGRTVALDTYAAAVAARYRFFSYGDACFFERRAERAA